MAVLATAVWRIRPSGSNTNGGGYDPGIAGAATDYSQQNAAQATGTHGTATGTTTFTDVAANFTAAMIGNALWIASGAGFTVGAYFITAFGSATSVTLDRSPGTGTVAIWALGGGWTLGATSNISSTGPLIGGNTVYVLGSGTPNPSSYTIDYPNITKFTPASGDSTNGSITIANDPATPGYKAAPDTTGGMPTLQAADTIFNGGSFIHYVGLWFTTVTAATTNGFVLNPVNSEIYGCVVDELTFYTPLVDGANWCSIIGCEVFSSTGRGGRIATAIFMDNSSCIDCNVHDTSNDGIFVYRGVVIGNIVANNSGYGIQSQQSAGSNAFVLIMNNTVDGNQVDGVFLVDTYASQETVCINNIISNQTVAGKFGLNVNSGSAALNDRSKTLIDFNTFYNNTANYNGISAGSHDTALGSTPYVNSATENYTLA